MRKSISKVLYGLVGLLLVVSLIFTGTYGLADEDRNSYTRALEQQSYVDSLGFSYFSLLDYSVVVYIGEKEYVLQGEEITPRKPMLGSFAATAYQADDHYEVFMPTFKDLSNTINAVGTFAGERGEGYQQSDHVATMWHEAFHAWQFTNYMSNIDKFVDLHDNNENGFLSNEVHNLDNNNEYRRLFLEEQRLLIDAYNADSSADMKSILVEWAELAGKTNGLLTDTQNAVVAYYELVEGSAYYVESKVYAHLEGAKVYENYYLTLSDEYVNGSSKYYQGGMLKCLLLDRLSPGWQSNFTFDKDMNTLLLSAITSQLSTVGE